jgi:hypothetical protein
VSPKFSADFAQVSEESCAWCSALAIARRRREVLDAREASAIALMLEEQRTTRSGLDGIRARFRAHRGSSIGALALDYLTGGY